MGFLGWIRRAVGRTRTPEEAFTAQVAATVNRLPGIARIERTADFGLRVHRSEGGMYSIFLGTLFSETKTMSAADRRSTVNRFVAAMFATDQDPETWAEAGPRLRPVLRTSSFAMSGLGDRATPVSRPWRRHLVEMLVVDYEDRMSVVTSENLDRWGVTAEDAFRRASATMTSEGTSVAKLANGVYHVASDDTYESSRLIIPGWLAGFAEHVGFRPVAVVPARDMMLLADGDDEAAVGWMLAEAAKLFGDHPRRLSPVPYTIDDAGIVIPWRPDPAHPAVAKAHRLLDAVEYGEQKTRMRTLFERAGEDLRIEDFLLDNVANGAARSMTVWPREAQALLPYTDDIAFPAEDGTFKVSWQQAAAVLGDEWEEAPTTPERRRTLRWPDESTLARLRAQSSGV